MLDKKTFLIGLLSLSALLLLLANILAPRVATANYETTHDNNYNIVTATAIGGGDAIYIQDKNSGIMAVYVFNPNVKTLVLMDAQPIQNVFAKAIKR
jgi:hypothetical protein